MEMGVSSRHLSFYPSSASGLLGDLGKPHPTLSLSFPNSTLSCWAPVVVCFPHVRGTWRSGNARGWAPALTSCACRPRVGPRMMVRLARTTFRGPCDLRVRALHSPQASSTRPSVTSRRASATGAWFCASRSRHTGRSTATISTSTARAPRPTAASTSRPPCRPRSPGAGGGAGRRLWPWGPGGWSRWRWGWIGSPRCIWPPPLGSLPVVQRTQKGLGPGPGHQAPQAQPWVWLHPGCSKGAARALLGSPPSVEGIGGLSLTEPGTKGWIPESSRPAAAAWAQSSVCPRAAPRQTECWSQVWVLGAPRCSCRMSWGDPCFGGSRIVKGALLKSRWPHPGLHRWHMSPGPDRIVTGLGSQP